MSASDEWIFSKEAEQWLDVVKQLLSENKETIQILKSLRKSVSAERARLLVQLSELRMRAARKFSRSEQMFFVRKQLEQASSQIIAEYKANRFSNFSRVVDLCCGIGGDAIGLANHAQLTIVDSDPYCLKMAERNLAAYGLKADAICGDVVKLEVERFDAAHCDPDRRPTKSKSRFTRSESFSPSQGQLNQLIRRNPNFGIKLAPGTYWGQEADCELEFVGHDRECKQQVVWTGDLVAEPGIRATVLSQDGKTSESFHVAHESPADADFETEMRQYVYDPHSSLLAANLVADFALQNEMKLLCGVSNYLSSDEHRVTQLASCFEVVDVLRPHKKSIEKYLKENEVGQLELKKRGEVGLLFNQISAVRLAGPNKLTLMMTSTPVGFRVIACRRC